MTKADAHQEYRRAVVQACAIELESAQTAEDRVDRHAALMRARRMRKSVGVVGTLPNVLRRKIEAQIEPVEKLA